MDVTFNIPDTDLERALKFLGATDQSVGSLMADYFTEDCTIDFDKITDEHERYYHTNGIVALLLTLQQAMDAANNIP